MMTVGMFKMALFSFISVEKADVMQEEILLMFSFLKNLRPDTLFLNTVTMEIPSHLLIGLMRTSNTWLQGKLWLILISLLLIWITSCSLTSKAQRKESGSLLEEAILVLSLLGSKLATTPKLSVPGLPQESLMLFKTFKIMIRTSTLPLRRVGMIVLISSKLSIHTLTQYLIIKKQEQLSTFRSMLHLEQLLDKSLMMNSNLWLQIYLPPSFNMEKELNSVLMLLPWALPPLMPID